MSRDTATLGKGGRRAREPLRIHFNHGVREREDRSAVKYLGRKEKRRGAPSDFIPYCIPPRSLKEEKGEEGKGPYAFGPAKKKMEDYARWFPLASC